MALSAGEKLGPYQIEALIGAGGMGEVYKARDTRLDRFVALKVSRQEFSERFAREAQAIATLNHPNICTLHDVGPNYLVMEFVEGKPLKGPLPLEDALRYAAQIADALDAAHSKKITHRDLKPANILVTKAGVKLLDFGLAKIDKPVAVSEETLTMGLTMKGQILGTLQYMSPEQVNGQEAGPLSDIFSFGLVLYEMLTGKRAFEGATPASVIAAILERPAPSVADVAPPALDRVLKRCLEKNPEDRWQSARDLKAAIEMVAAGTGSQADSPEKPAGGFGNRLAWMVAAALGVIAIAVSSLHFRETPPPERTLRYTIAAPENSVVSHFAISPDGRNLVIAARVNGKQQLWLRPMDALESRPMPFTEEALLPFWSPDSRYIAFFAQGKLKKIEVSGGPAQTLCDARAGAARGGSWSRDDVIVFSSGSVGTFSTIQRVPAGGGVPADVIKTEFAYRYPVFLPDGHHFLSLLDRVSPEKNGAYFISLDGKENRRILADQSGVVFAAGHLLFIRDNTLMAQPFNPEQGRTTGDVFPVADGVSLAEVNYVPVSVSANGLLLYQRGRNGASLGSSLLEWRDRAGKTLGQLGDSGSGWPSISPDEKTVAFNRATGPSTTDLWLWDLARGTPTRFTAGPGGSFGATWSPKGDRIVFAHSDPSGKYQLIQKAASGSGRDDSLLPNSTLSPPNGWSRDGQFIVYTQLGSKVKMELWVLPVGGRDRKPFPFLQTGSNELQGQFSPDGRWMAYTSDESGAFEVYVRPFPPGDGKYKVSTAGGYQPRWRADGKELFYVAADGKMTAVSVKAGAGPKPSFEPGTPVPLFDSHIEITPLTNISAPVPMFDYDVTADGKRFLVAASSATSTAALTVEVNWTARLKK